MIIDNIHDLMRVINRCKKTIKIKIINSGNVFSNKFDLSTEYNLSYFDKEEATYEFIFRVSSLTFNDIDDVFYLNEFSKFKIEIINEKPINDYFKYLSNHEETTYVEFLENFYNNNSTINNKTIIDLKEIPIDSIIEIVLQEFDFEKVYHYMKLTNWKWASLNDVPNIQNLKDQAIELLKDVINIGMKEKEDYSISTGGLKANFFMTGTISLEFILEDFKIYGNEYLENH